MAGLSIVHFMLTTILLFTSSMQTKSKGYHHHHRSENSRLVPVGGAEYRTAEEGEPFQVCSECRCCTQGDPTNCSQMPCCYAIDCDLPDKPYGVCAFVPKSCDCTDCT